MLPLEQALYFANQEFENIQQMATSELFMTGASLKDDGWLFEYNTLEFAESRSWLHRLGGNSPILVKHDGSVEIVPIHEGRDGSVPPTA